MIRAVKKENSSTSEVLPDIIQAAYRSDTELVSKLISMGVDVNTVDPRDNLTCLHIACLQGDEALVNVLLAHHQKFRDLDFTIKSTYRPRLAWQYAMNGNFFELARKVEAAGRRQSVGMTPSGPSGS